MKTHGAICMNSRGIAPTTRRRFGRRRPRRTSSAASPRRSAASQRPLSHATSSGPEQHEAVERDPAERADQHQAAEAAEPLRVLGADVLAGEAEVQHARGQNRERERRRRGNQLEARVDVVSREEPKARGVQQARRTRRRTSGEYPTMCFQNARSISPQGPYRAPTVRASSHVTKLNSAPTTAAAAQVRESVERDLAGPETARPARAEIAKPACAGDADQQARARRCRE